MGNPATEEGSVVEELAKELANEFRKVSDKPLQKACEELLLLLKWRDIEMGNYISAGYIRKSSGSIFHPKHDVIHELDIL